jgi:uncharacterized protein
MHAPYYTRPMAAGPTDLVNCARLAEEAAELEREYELHDLPRVKEMLAAPGGTVRATYAFATLAAGRAGATVSVRAMPQLVCQRCMQGFDFIVESGSEVEFASSDDDEESDAERELFRAKDGLVSLRELAEEELLLALPIVAACDVPQTCGRAPSLMSGEAEHDAADEMRRPFSALHDLLKKT